MDSNSSTGSTGAWKRPLSGAMGGMAAVLLSHPLDSLRVHRQLAGAAAMPVDLRRLYRGVLPPLLGGVPVSALAFATFEFTRSQLQQSLPTLSQTHGHGTLLLIDCLAGTFAALPACCLIIPGERLKILQQTTGTTPTATATTIQPNASTSRGRAVRWSDWYRGHSLITLARDVPAYAVWFSSYFAIRRWQQQQHRANGSTGTNDVIDSLMAGSAAGVLQWTLTLPMDAMKTRIQSRPLGERLPTIRQCWQQLAAGDGGSISARMRLLYRGYWAAVGRAIPSNGISWLVTETIFKWLTTRN